MKVSEDLKKELQEWWEDATGPQPSKLAKSVGLCVYVKRGSSYLELNDLFEDLYGQGRINSISSPFNARMSYAEECNNQACHMNPNRLAFVRSILDAQD